MPSAISIVKIHSDEAGKKVNMLVVGNEVFDWGIDEASLIRTKKMIDQRPDMKESISMSIINHFVDCFCEFLGRSVTLPEIVEAIKKGEI
jgi:hypothetical protein